jgi:hypothetical protein
MDYDNCLGERFGKVERRKRATKRATKMERRERATKVEWRERATKMEQINSKRRIAERHSKEKNKTIEAWMNTYSSYTSSWNMYAPPTHQELVYEEYALDVESDILWEEWMRRNDWRFDGEYYP